MAYESVNGKWPEGALPPLTGPEAISAAKRLYRFIMKKRWTGQMKLTSGRRSSWVRWWRGTIIVNPQRGWHDLVHELSHDFHRRLHPGDQPHGMHHAWIERTMIEYVVSHGWLEGKLKRPEKPQHEVDLKSIRHERILSRIQSWEAKKRRAENALKKLQRQRKYYEQALAA